jgi:alpha-ketoglutarate-dependent 2,4-dichlorophenoxyacetate dioxygenase
MSVIVNPLHPVFAAEVIGLDLKQPTSALRDEVDAIMNQYAVSCIRDQFIDDEQQVAFSRLFGDLELQPATRGNKARSPFPEIFNVTNLDAGGGFQKEGDLARQYRLGNHLWHTDSSFRKISGVYSLLSARTIPPVGADTEFVDTRAAYDALPEKMKARVEGLVAEHSIFYSRALNGGYTPSEEELKARPPAQHPLVRLHPGSKRKALYIAAHISHIVGWPHDESRALIDELMDFATQPQFIYAHKWRDGDMVIWDNRCTMHRATPFEDNLHIRDLRRTTVREKVAVTA